ncbi:MAG: transcription elongation factor GreA [Oscillospiraceae bacterium]|jgi:transcription elongation factor GreA|nr:transcription elongation factor GreA [Oscillospiraceae bacterium]
MADTTNKGRPVMSADGLAKLEEELNHLKLVKRKEIAEQIKTAISFGDLSENAEYDEAKNEQARIEGQISQLENMMRTAIVVEESAVTTEEVGIGSVVNVLDVDSNRETQYKIVGAREADPMEGRISSESPVGKALMGAKPGEEVTFEIPKGMRTLRVLSIHR